jgi:hypothetical protein
MSNVEVNKLLEQIKKLNREAEKVNQKAEQNRGFKNAQIELIKADEQKLAALGIDLNLEIDEKGNIPEDRIQNFVQVFKKEYSAKVKQVARTEKLITAIENNDTDTIKALTGIDVKEETYDLEISSVKELIAKEEEELSAVKEQMAQQGEAALGGSPVDVVEATVKEEVKEVITQGVVNEVLQEEVVEDEVEEEDNTFTGVLGNDFGLDEEDEEDGEDVFTSFSFGTQEEEVEEPKVKEEVKEEANPVFKRRTTRVVQTVEEDEGFGAEFGLFGDDEDEEVVEDKKPETKAKVDIVFEADEVEDNELSDKGHQVNMFFSGMNKAK